MPNFGLNFSGKSQHLKRMNLLMFRHISIDDSVNPELGGDLKFVIAFVCPEHFLHH
jgi:hypothetical protein